jgi:excisionase family DNA binding protein
MIAKRPNPPQDDPGDEILGEPLLISVSELATILKISPRSVWRLLSAGKMVEPIRIGGTVRWRFSEVKDWIQQGCPPTDGGRK